jgi:hypothetical protein
LRGNAGVGILTGLSTFDQLSDYFCRSNYSKADTQNF